MKLEYVDSLILAHPFIRGFEQVSYCLSEDEVRAVAEGEISDSVAGRKKEDIEGKEGAGPVYSTTFYIGLAIEPKPSKPFLFKRLFSHSDQPSPVSRCYWSSTARYILSHDGLYKTRQDVGEIR